MNVACLTDKCEPMVMNLGEPGTTEKNWVIVCSKHGRIGIAPFSPYVCQTGDVRKWYHDKWEEHMDEMKTPKNEPETDWQSENLPVHLL